MPYQEETILILNIFWDVFKAWWWVLPPLILYRPFLFLWSWWRNEEWDKTQKSILLEIKIPKEVTKPIRAMEQVFAGIWQALYKPADWHEKWIVGEFQLSISLEIASINGETHFFVRIPESSRDTMEANIYSQYPEAEISLAEDYTKLVPQNIPNKDWDLWGSDYRLLKPSPYPIKTYLDFERESETKEERKIDPVAVLLESMAKVKKGEQLWVQIKCVPVGPNESPWISEGEQIRDKLAQRPSPLKLKSVFQEAFNLLVFGPEETKEKKTELIPPEMRLTPGERDVVSAIERKISKTGFKTNIRFIYFGKRDVFFKPNMRLGFNFFANYSTENLNKLIPFGETITKIHVYEWFYLKRLLKKRLMYLKQRIMFRNYVKRFAPFFPGHGKAGVFILNIEELASLYHFPGQITAPAPSISRTETKKGEAPSGLPIE